MADFTPADVHAVHHAMIEATQQAADRAERMPSSADALRKHAAQLRAVREKILDRLPPEHRRSYTDPARPTCPIVEGGKTAHVFTIGSNTCLCGEELAR